jgi:hypothetical protein
MREVRGEESPFCTIPGPQVADHFQDVFQQRLDCLPEPPEDAELPPTLQHADPLVAYINRASIVARLSHCSNTAPGADGVRYSCLRMKDPNAHILVEILNRCLSEKRIPAAWKSSRTILLHKKGEKNNISNWRPISLSSCLYKIYAGILADRLGRWAGSSGAVSKVQKGFMPYEGCSEHNFILQQCLDDARETGSQLTVTWLDLRNAFPSVPHTSILAMLKQHGVHPHLVDIVQDLYTDCSTTFCTDGGETEAVPMKSGVKQGCPLSPIVFNLTLEVLIRSVMKLGEQRGFSLLGHTISCLAYADDLVLTAKSTEDMQALLDTAGSVADWLGLSFNASKCATLQMTKKKAVPTNTTIQGQPVPCLREGEAYRHLGVPTGFRNDQTPENTIKAMLEDIHRVETSRLTDWQKLDAIRTFVLPQVEFTLLTARVKKTAFKEFDSEVKRVSKAALHLPARGSPEIVYLPLHQGGANILPLGDLADICAVTHAFKLLTCPDPAVSTIAWRSVKRAVQRTLADPQVSEEQVAAYLSGAPLARPSNSFATIWSHARNASSRLSGKISDFKWCWSTELGRLAVNIPMPDLQPDRILVDSAARKTLQSKLRRGVQHHYLKNLTAKPDHGKVFLASSADPASNHFIHDGRHTRFCDWRFVHRARNGVLPLNGCLRGLPDRAKQCRRCNYELESIAHVLCHCLPHQRAWNNRHRSVLLHLVDNMEDTSNLTIEKTVRGTNSRLMPDLVILDRQRMKATIIDVACPFDNKRDALDAKRLEKVTKYQPLADTLKSQGFTAECDAVVVGSLGSWDPRNESALNLLGIPARKRTAMKRLIVSDVIRWSRDIYVEHMCGHRQYSRDLDLPSLRGPTPAAD